MSAAGAKCTHEKCLRPDDTSSVVDDAVEDGGDDFWTVNFPPEVCWTKVSVQAELQNVKFFTQINSFQINLPQQKALKS